MNLVRPETQQDYHERINRVILYIDQHRSDELSLDRLASVACLSPFHFHRIFRALVGEPLGRYVQRVRLDTAAVHLQTSNRSVTEISLEAGYDSVAAFSRAFETHFGMAPTECRKAHRLELSVRTAQLLNTMPTKITPEIRQRPATPVAFVRHVGPYAEVGRAWGKLCEFAGRQGLLGPATQCIGLGWDDPNITPEDKVRYDACLTMERPIQAVGEIGAQTIPGGRFAVFLHAGPYEKLSETYDQIFRGWLPASGEQLADRPAFELYLNMPGTTPPADLRTEVWVPLQ